jgi:hypothetical protein
MNTNITLTEEQRSTLQESADDLAKLLKKLAALGKSHSHLVEVKTKATGKLAAAEKIAEEQAGEEEGEIASAKAIAIRDQLSLLDRNIRHAEGEYAKVMEEAQTDVFIARTKIRAAHRPLVESLITEAADLLAPFSERPHHARNVATDLYAVGQIRIWTRPNMPANHFRSSGSIVTDIEWIGRTLAAMLAGEAVVTVATGGEVGGMDFPQFC